MTTDCPTADLVAYLHEFHDEYHQNAAARLEAYEHVIFTALRRGDDFGEELGRRGGLAAHSSV